MSTKKHIDISIKNLIIQDRDSGQNYSDIFTTFQLCVNTVKNTVRLVRVNETKILLVSCYENLVSCFVTWVHGYENYKLLIYLWFRVMNKMVPSFEILVSSIEKHCIFVNYLKLIDKLSNMR